MKILSATCVLRFSLRSLDFLPLSRSTTLAGLFAAF